MALSGNTRELSLADLILVKAQESGSYRVRITGPAGDGILLIEAGRVVHAAYGQLPAEDAACLLVTEENVDFSVESDAEIAGHTVELGVQELLLESMRRLDEGILKRPRPVPIHVGVGARREPPRPRSHEARRSPEAEALRRATGRILFAEADGHPPARRGRWLGIGAGLGAALAVAALVALAWQRGWLEPREHRSPAQLSDLNGPRDLPPMLLAGAPAASPDPDAALLPSILVKLLIDDEGRVRDASLGERRSGLEVFEEAALDAVKAYRFAPAMREARAVPVWMDWPVDFVRRPAPSATPVPVDRSLFSPSRDEEPRVLETRSPEPPPADPRRPTMKCRVLVSPEGTVDEVELVGPRDGFAELERRALEAARGFRFTPGRREGVLVPTWTYVDVRFESP